MRRPRQARPDTKLDHRAPLGLDPVHGVERTLVRAGLLAAVGPGVVLAVSAPALIAAGAFGVALGVTVALTATGPPARTGDRSDTGGNPFGRPTRRMGSRPAGRRRGDVPDGHRPKGH
jgi:hypothetical protein